jgi:hypothetical protein
MAEYRIHRGKRAFALVLMRIILDKYLDNEGKEASDKVVDEFAPHNESILAQDVIREVYNDLANYESYNHAITNQYSWKKGDPVAGPLPGVDPETDRGMIDEPAAKPKKPQRKKKKSEPPPEGGAAT